MKTDQPMKKPFRWASLALAFFGCGGSNAGSSGPGHLELPVHQTTRGAAVTAAREQPPPSGAAKPAPFPHVYDRTLKNGVSVAIVEAHALPIAQLRVVLHAGMGYSPREPGAAELTAEMLKDGGTRSMTSAELLKRIESLGANLSVSVTPDATTVSTAVTRDHLPEALAIVAEVVQAPRFDEQELTKLKAREIDDAEDRLRSSGQFSAMRTIFRELFVPTSPYASYGLLPGDVAKITSATIRDHYRRFYVPKNAQVVLVGDVKRDEADAQIERAFSGWAGADAPKVDFPPAEAPSKRKVIVTHRAKSAQSDVFVASIGPARKVDEWPSARVCNQVLGGGVAGRLFLDVREQRSLAYSAYSRITELSHGPQPVVAYAGTRTEKTADAVAGLLENLDGITRNGVTESEVETARRYLSDVFAIRMETIGSIADMVAELWTLGLPYDYWDKYREAVRATSASAASSVAPKLYHPDSALIVVAGDADVIAPTLTRFGDVTVLDPERSFATVRTLKASAPEPK